MMDTQTLLSRYLRVASAEPQSDDCGWAAALVRDGCSVEQAWELVRFVPIALGRLFLEGLGIRFSSEYLKLDAEGNLLERGKIDDIAVFSLVMGKGTSVVSGRLVGQLGPRSSEVHAVNAALHAGSKSEGLIAAPPLIFDEPPSELGLQRAQEHIEQYFAAFDTPVHVASSVEDSVGMGLASFIEEELVGLGYRRAPEGPWKAAWTRKTWGSNRAVVLLSVDEHIDPVDYLKRVRKEIAGQIGYFPFLYTLAFQVILEGPLGEKPLSEAVDTYDNQRQIVQSVFVVDMEARESDSMRTWGQVISGKYQDAIGRGIDRFLGVAESPILKIETPGFGKALPWLLVAVVFFALLRALLGIG